MKLFRRVLLVIIMTLLAMVIAVWWHLLDGLCASPLVPDLSTGNTIAYNCHGSVVYITEFQEALLHWLIPGAFLLILVGYVVRKWQPLT